ncbi:deoxycytidyl transferase [Mortierella claussenii]|nr:deoxycytidyl transferase [Mortierella claussenii]
MEREEEDDPYEAIKYGDFSTYFRHKKQKLQLQQEEIAALAPEDTAQIFEGVVVYVNGYTDPPIHGGEFRQYLSKSSITHIIASNLTQAKMKEFRNYKVAKPAWIVESVKANRLLSWRKFSTLRVPSSLTKLTESMQLSSASSFGPHQLPVAELSSASSGAANAMTNDRDMIQVINDTVMIHDQDETDKAWMQDQEEGEDLFPDDIDIAELEQFLTPPNPESDHVDVVTSFVDPPPTQHSISEPLLNNAHHGIADSFGHHTHVAHNSLSCANHMPPLIEWITTDEGDHGMDGTLADGFAIMPSTLGTDDRHPTLIELSIPWNRLNSSVQPGFVEKFYQSSRLHYLSTWKAKLRNITTEIQKNKPTVTSNTKSRTIMHIDFDCFFASVATRGKPELQNRPIAVAHGSGGSTSNSEIASCNYLARGFGVKNGMQLLKARALCPELMVVPYEFELYEDISIEFYKILLGYADELQAVSVDEALLDVTSKCIPFSGAEIESGGRGGSLAEASLCSARMLPGLLAEQVRKEIFETTGCHASVGIAPNILLAKLATQRAKPHGQYIWPSSPGSERTLHELQGPSCFPLPLDSQDYPDQSFTSSDDGSQNRRHEEDIATTAAIKKPGKVYGVKDLPGVGYKIGQDLQERFRVRTLFELQQVSKEELQRYCGMKTGEMLYNSCRGIDDTTLASDRDKARQSVSAEISWGVRFENQDQVDVFLSDLAHEVSKRLKEINRKGKAIVVKIMKRKEYVKGAWKHLGHGPVDQFARTGQLPMYTDDPGLIGVEARKLLLFFKFDVLDLRGLGIQVLKLNNDVINTVPKSAFVTPDSMNQTTLTSTMFKQKQPTVAQAGETHEFLQTSLATNNASDSSADTEQRGRTENNDPMIEMEIDSDTFKELPSEIQEELSHQYRLVFVKQGSGTSAKQEPSKDQAPLPPPSLEVLCDEDNHRIPARQDITVSDQQTSLLPWSQVDPAELMALSTPMIRDTLKEYAGKKSCQTTDSRGYTAESSANYHQKLLQQNMDGGSSILPSPSKLDKSVLQALPPEIRAEIEQEYTHIMENHELIRKLAHPGMSDGDSSNSNGHNNNNNSHNGGALLSAAAIHLSATTTSMDPPSSSREKSRAAARGTSVRGRSRGRPRGTGGRGRGRAGASGSGSGNSSSNSSGGVHGDPSMEYEQVRGEYASTVEHDDDATAQADPLPELDPNFLAALPSDLRAEVVRSHKLEVLKLKQRQAALAETAKNQLAGASRRHADHHHYHHHHHHHHHHGHEGNGRELVKKSVLPERPTLMGLRKADELRQMLAEWVQSTLLQDKERLGVVAAVSVDVEEVQRNLGMDPAAAAAAAESGRPMLFDEGPNPEDVQSFSEFIARVIYMERDLDRVRVLLRYLRRKIQENAAKAAPKDMNPSHIRVLMSWPEALQRLLQVSQTVVMQLYGGMFSID